MANLHSKDWRANSGLNHLAWQLWESALLEQFGFVGHFRKSISLPELELKKEQQLSSIHDNSRWCPKLLNTRQTIDLDLTSGTNLNGVVVFVVAADQDLCLFGDGQKSIFFANLYGMNREILMDGVRFQTWGSLFMTTPSSADRSPLCFYIRADDAVLSAPKSHPITLGIHATTDRRKP